MKRIPYLTAILMVLISAPGLQAGDLAGACSEGGLTSLQSYLDLGGDSCSVGILNYSHFSFFSSGTGSPTLLTASDIKLTPLAPMDGLSGGFTIGTVSGSPFSVGDGQTAEYQIMWTFVIDPGPISTAGNLEMDPPFGDASITQTFCPDSNFDGTICYNYPQTLHVYTLPTPHLVDTLTFSTPIENFAQVLTTISLNGETVSGGAGFDAAIGTPTIVDTSAPEPGGALLAMAGLGLAALRRKLRMTV